MESPSYSTPFSDQRQTSPMRDAGVSMENEEYKNEPSPLQQLEHDLIDESMITQDDTAANVTLA